MWSSLTLCVRYASILVLPIALFVLWYRKRYGFVKSINKFPGPPTLPIVGNALDCKLDPVDMFKTMMRNSIYGPVYRFWIIFVPLVMVESAHHIELILKDIKHHYKSENYYFLHPWMGQGLLTSEALFELVKEYISFGAVYKVWLIFTPQVMVQGAQELETIVRDSTYNSKSSNYRFLHSWMGDGLLTASDEKWRVHRKVLTPAFHFNILQEFLPIFNTNALKLTKRLANEAEATAVKGFNIFKHTSLCSLDIICESAMGLQINAQENENSPYVTSVNRITDLLVKRYFTPWLRNDFIFNLSSVKREMYGILDYLNDFTDKVIDKRRKYLATRKSLGDDQADAEFGKRRSLAFLDLLLAAEEEEVQHMTQKDIRDQVSTFMFEGHDTVSTATSWALFLIGTYPHVQKLVVEELVEVFGDSGREPSMNDLANLKYLERCIKESLRLFPSVPFYERNIKGHVTLGTHYIPGGTNVTLNAFMVHRDPEFWPDPEKFDPDRFTPENSQGRHPYAYVPFSAGPRNCIGQRYAMLEEKVVISTVLRHFRVEAAHPVEEAELQISLILRPRNGLRVRLYERSDLPNLRVSSNV